MIKEIHLLYAKYSEELQTVRKTQLVRAKILDPHFDDIESELLYMFIREYSPNHIIEFSPHFGWSTSWILEALNQNNNGRCISYDLKDKSSKVLPTIKSLDLSRWDFVLGDVQKHYAKFDYSSIDFIFIDADHSKRFSRQYVQNVLYPAQNHYRSQGQKIPIFIHDIFGNYKSSIEEGSVVRKFLTDNEIEFVTPSNSKKFIQQSSRYLIDRIRQSLGLSDFMIHKSKVNPAVIFKLG